MLIIHFIAFPQDIGTVYQIFADEVLGSGQFGVVYGGMKLFEPQIAPSWTKVFYTVRNNDVEEQAKKDNTSIPECIN